MKKLKIAGVDQGTTSTKILSLNESGKCEIKFQRLHKQITKNPGWVEHDPDEIFSNIIHSLESVNDIDAIGLSHQGETIVAWDSNTKEALYNMIVWQDQRTQKTVEKLKKEGYEPIIQEKTGLLLDSYFPASKMAWLIENVPKVQTALKENRLRMGTSESFFLDRLTGVYCTDYNSASRTSLFNANTLEWDVELCDIFNVPIDILPPIRDSIGDFGSTKIKGKNVPVTAVMVDQFASAYGHGCREKGDSKATFGTGAFMQVLTGEEFVIDKKTGLSSALFWKFPGEKPIFGMDAGVYNVASAVNWAKSLGLFVRYEQLNKFDKGYAIERDITFVPALSGLSCPHWDRTAAGVWAGMSLDTTKEDLMQSLLEGIAFRAVENFNVMNNFAQLSDTISVDGGLVSNPYFVNFFASMVNKNIHIPKNAEITSLGISMLAYKGLTGRDFKSEKSEKEIIKHKNIENREMLMAKFDKVIQKSKGLRES